MDKRIDVITSGLISGGDIYSNHKGYTRATIRKCLQTGDDLEIILKEEEMENLDLNHDDALVISIIMINARIKRVIIDTNISVDILYYDTFQKLKPLTNDLTPMTSSLTGFTDYLIFSLEIINLHVMFGDEPYSKIITKFMIVDIPSVYNAIISQLMLNRLRAVVLTYYIVIKFTTRISIRELRSNIRE